MAPNLIKFRPLHYRALPLAFLIEYIFGRNAWNDPIVIYECINYNAVNTVEIGTSEVLKSMWRRNFMERSMCGSSLVGTRTTGTRLPSCSLSAWIGYSTHLTPVSSHHRVPLGPRGLRCSLGYSHCLLQCICQVYVEEKLYREKYMWFIIGSYLDNWHKVKDNRLICTVEQLEEALQGHLTTQSIILHQVPSMTEVGMTAQQFTERLDRMLNTPDTSLITSQATLRSPWPKMQSGL
ncbi:hypothetical protein RRG08_054956 [Elysia crispata]|uniref:Uncharacterized protein n=1 Tax=Elysia crispata TaxID=231223 RepID=A0AAE0YZR6_9GAST|nr:hypothetical protein RRG08_054956 [Elysia crispata]